MSTLADQIRALLFEFPVDAGPVRLHPHDVVMIRARIRGMAAQAERLEAAPIAPIVRLPVSAIHCATPSANTP